MLIQVEFKGGKKVIYTEQVIPLLMSDKDVIEVINIQTGELMCYTDSKGVQHWF